MKWIDCPICGGEPQDCSFCDDAGVVYENGTVIPDHEFWADTVSSIEFGQILADTLDEEDNE